jgi:hypothetical protein
VNLNCTVRRTVCESFAMAPIRRTVIREMLERFSLGWNRKPLPFT